MSLLAARAPVFPVPPVTSPAVDDPLHPIVALLSRELATPAPGQPTVLDRLLDILLVLALRTHYQQSLTPPAGSAPQPTPA